MKKLILFLITSVLFPIGLKAYQQLKTLRTSNGTQTKLTGHDLQPLRRSKWSGLEKYVLAQATHETDYFKSSAFLNSNNSVGMKDAVKRKQLGLFIPETKYRDYKNVREGIADLVLYYEEMNFPQNVTGVDDYVRALKDRGYFTDSYANYLNGMKRFL